MNKRLLALALGVFAVGGGAGFGVRGLFAAGIPDVNTLYYTGTLTDNGTPMNGPQTIAVNLWSDDVPNGTLLCQTSKTVTVANGLFRVPLDPLCKAQINQNKNAWVEVLVGAINMGRTKIGSVPYSVEADHATRADNAANAAVAAAAAPGSFAVPGTLAVAGGGSVGGVLSVGLHASTTCTFNAPLAFTDCVCGANEAALSGGAYSGPGGRLDESRQVAVDTWRVGCQNSAGTRIQCLYPIAMCARLSQ
jgi:hypothetical protein